MSAILTSEPTLPRSTDFRVRDAQWFAWAQGRPLPSVDETPLPGEPPEDDESVAPSVTGLASTTDLRELPTGLGEDLVGTPFGRPARSIGRTTGLDDALALAFGLVRREPENPFNDHRALPSVRSKFPVQAFVSDPGVHRVLDCHRHALRTLTHDPEAAGSSVLLAARWSSLPGVYRWVRGSLVNIELGINLRMLAIAMAVCGATGQVRMPRAGSGLALLDRLGVPEPTHWAQPFVVEPVGTVPAVDPATREPVEQEEALDDPVLDEVRRIDRAQVFPAAADPLPTGLAAVSLEEPPSWTEVLWSRSGGRMPEGQYGMDGTPSPVSPAAIRDMAGWASAEVPRSWQPMREAIGLHVAVQHAPGLVDGLYRVRDGALDLTREESGLAAELEQHYGYPLAPGNGCDVRHAQAVWFFAAPIRDLVDRHGAAGWTGAQHATGWAAQGLVLAAAAHGMYARPVRAFREEPTRHTLGLGEREMITLAVICGTARTHTPTWDMRP